MVSSMMHQNDVKRTRILSMATSPPRFITTMFIFQLLAGVLVATGQTNLALFRPATQSSTYDVNEANRAVDGDISSAALTGGGIRHPWWKVQLAYPVWLTRVEIIGVLHKAWMFNLEIRVGRDGEVLENNNICVKPGDFSDSGVADITCLHALFGDWISISKSSTGSPFYGLAFEEVRVFEIAETTFEVSRSCQEQLSHSGPHPPCRVALSPGLKPVCELNSAIDAEALHAFRWTTCGASGCTLCGMMSSNGLTAACICAPLSIKLYYCVEKRLNFPGLANITGCPFGQF